jgi:hypothetical protein
MRRHRGCRHPSIPWQRRWGGVWLAVALGLPVWLAGCGLLAGQPRQRPYAPVVLLDTQGLEPPAVTFASSAFRATGTFDLDEADPARGRGVGFFVTLSTGDPDALIFRLTDKASLASKRLARIAPPADDTERAAAAALQPFSADSHAQLAGGQGVFWLDLAADAMTYRFGVLIPQAQLAALCTLAMYTSTAADGTPVNAATLDLTRDFFYLAIIGESVVWGNGLEEQDKWTTLAAQAIERETGRKVIWQRYAQSGARILPAAGDSVCLWSCTGEVPVTSMSVTLQADVIERPDLMNLILMGACVNDVSLDVILMPGTPTDQLTALTQQFCGDEMKTLLEKVRGLAPGADIIVAGYYPMIGPNSDTYPLDQWLNMRASTADDALVISVLAAQSQIFCTASNASLQGAVDQVNTETGGTHIALADPGYSPDNATFAPQAWNWGLTADAAFLGTTTLDYQVFPEDPLRNFRLSNCIASDNIADRITCIYASVGHPNPRGAQAYGDAVIARLRDLGVLPAAKAAQPGAGN